ncbi:MAG: zinc ribbon domain-containing protein [Oribacterium sp.]|nr:zinc ribbon domain-containing protein [Oribacterium sp.]
MKYCKFCGTQLRDDASFCSQCGKNVKMSAPNMMPKQGNGQNIPVQNMMPGKSNAPRMNGSQMNAPRMNAPKCQKKSGGGFKKALCCILAVVLFVELAFFHPGFLRGKEPVETITPTEPVIPGNGNENGNPKGKDIKLTDFQKEVVRCLGTTEDAFKEALKNPIEVTPENSPGNPSFIDVSFSESEFDEAPTLTADVSREFPEADFPEFGIHIDLKSWNLLNDTDTLIVKKLPWKKDPVTGCELYTYSYSLASGQDHFSTNVEVTVPIQGDPRIFDGVLYRNDSTGKWEEVYYKLSEDGHSYIAHMDHFSEDAQKSDPETLKKMKEMGMTVEQFYKENGKSLFKIMPYEDVAKYVGSQTWLFGVGLTSIPDFDKFSRLDSNNANKILSEIMNESGGIPAEASITEALGTLGIPNDLASGVSNTLELLKQSKEGTFRAYAGLGLTGMGTLLLWLRVADQYRRGVDPQKIKQSNRWNFLSTLSGLSGAIMSQLGSMATAAGTMVAGVSAGAVLTYSSVFMAAFGIGFYIASLYDGYVEKKNKEKEEQTFSTIEEAAYFYYLTEYDMSDQREVIKTGNIMSSARAFERVVGEDPTEYDDTHDHHNKRVDLKGKNWAYALRYLFDKYQSNPKELDRQVRKLYNRFVDSFWTVDVSDEERYYCWCKALDNILDSGYFGYHYSPGSNPSENTLKILGITREEHDRRCKLQNMVDNAGSVDKFFERFTSEKSKYVMFNKLTDEQVMAFKTRAYNTLIDHINPMIYEIYQTEYEKGIVEARIKLRDEVLPFLNTRITFYAKDLSLKNGEFTRLESPYYQFKEDGVGKKGANVFEFVSDHNPVFAPANDGAGQFCNWGLYLFANRDTPVLLETNVYHYLRFGCPTKVKVRETISPFGTTLPEIEGTVNWKDVKLTTDENSLWNALPKNKGGNNAPVLPIKDMKVPIEYESGQEPDIEKFFGYWEQVGGPGNIISINRGGKKELLAYGERYTENDGKKKKTFDNGFAVDDWYYDRQKRELTLTSSGFLRGMIECTLIDDDYIEIKNGQGDINRYIRTDNGYDVSKLTETYNGSPSGKTTMGVGTTVNTLTFGGSDKKETKESK